MALNKIFVKLDTVIDQKISDFNIAIIKKGIGKTGEIDKQSFWKMKKLLSPKSNKCHIPYLTTMTIC